MRIKRSPYTGIIIVIIIHGGRRQFILFTQIGFGKTCTKSLLARYCRRELFYFKIVVSALRPARRHVFRVVVTARIYTRRVGLFIHYLFLPCSSIAHSVSDVVLGPFFMSKPPPPPPGVLCIFSITSTYFQNGIHVFVRHVST